MTITVDVIMDIDKILEDKIDKPSTKFFFNFVTLVYSYITSDAQFVNGFGSPVLTGRYYASHTINLNSVDQSVRPEGNYSQLSTTNVDALRSAFNLGDTVVIANSLPYADDIERGEASQKTPDGVYRVSVEAAKAKFLMVQGARLDG